MLCEFLGLPIGIVEVSVRLEYGSASRWLTFRDYCAVSKRRASFSQWRGAVSQRSGYPVVIWSKEDVHAIFFTRLR